MVATTAHAPGALGALGVVAVAFVGVALARGRISGIVVGVVLLGVAYMLSRIGQRVDAGAALFGSGLLVVAELGSWSFELRCPLREAPGGHRRRWLLLGAHVAGSAALGLVVLATGGRSSGMGLSGEMMSAAGAVAASALLAALAWRLRASPSVVSRGGDERGLP